MVDLAIPTALTALLIDYPVFDVRAALFALLGNDLTQIKASADIRAQVHRRVRQQPFRLAERKALYLLALPGAEQQDFGWQGALVAHAPLRAAGKRRS